MNEVQKYHATHSGRSATGRLRNFAAMNPGKLKKVAEALHQENNDMEAMARVETVMRARRLWDEGIRERPIDVPADVWDTLSALAL
jgi:hypothetical protein